MAFSYTDTVGDGVAKVFTFRFEGDDYGYFRASDIHVFVAGTEVPFMLTAPNQVELQKAPVLGARVLIRRIMPKNNPYSNWQRGNDFGARTVNNSFLQMLYMVQELYDGFMTDGFRFNQDLSMGGYKITDLGDGTNPADAVNYKQLMQVEGSAGKSAEAAAASAAAALASETNAKTSETNALQYMQDSKAYMTSSAASAAAALQAAKDAARSKAGAEDASIVTQGHVEATNRNKELAEAAAVSAGASSTSATAAARMASSEANRAKTEADRAKALADSFDTNAISTRLTAVEGVANVAGGKADTAVNTANLANTTAAQAKTIAQGALPKSGGTMTGSLFLKGDALNELEPVTKKQLDDAVKNAGGVPLATVMWWHDRATIQAGWLPADGQLVLRSQYPQFWEHVAVSWQTHMTSEQDWWNRPTVRAMYSSGDDATNFRLPDLNGKQSGSRAVVLRGDGNDSYGADGYIQGDQIGSHAHTRGTMNITGEITHKAPFCEWDLAANIISESGALKLLNSGFNNGSSNWDATNVRAGNKLVLNASDGWTGETSYVGGNETRMVNATGCFIIKAYGAAVNTGTMDASKLQQAIDTANSKVSGILEGKRLPSAMVFTKENSAHEGGQIVLEHNSDTRWNINIDQNTAPNGESRFRIFESEGGSRGVFLTFHKQNEGVGSQIVTCNADRSGKFEDNGGSNQGWRKLPDGYIEQWGYLQAVSVGGDRSFDVNLHFTMPNEVCNVQLTTISAYGADVGADSFIQFVSNTNSVLRLFRQGIAGAGTGMVGVMWRVLGR